MSEFPAVVLGLEDMKGSKYGLLLYSAQRNYKL